MSTQGTSLHRPSSPNPLTVEHRSSGPSNQAHPTHRLDEASSSRTITARHVPNIRTEQIAPPQVVQPSLRSSFADRHPKIVSALTNVASKAAFISAGAALTPAFLAATPARLAVLALSVISPKAGVNLLKNKYVRFTVGPLGNSFINSTYRSNRSAFKKRMAFAALLGLDALSLGISMSGASAFDVAVDLKNFVKTRLPIALGISHTTNNTPSIQHRNHQEDQAVRALLHNTPRLSKTIQKIFNRLGPDATPTRGIDQTKWRQYDNKPSESGSSSKAFSALLQKVSTGFIGTNIDSQLTDSQKAQYIALVNERIKPVLLIMQSNEAIASKLFAWAEQGLGSCEDRAASAWHTLELCALSLNKAHQAIEELKNNNHMTPKAKAAIQAFVQIELQQFRLSEVKRHTKNLIQDEQRDPFRGGWQHSLPVIPYKKLDHVEVFLNIADSLQRANPEWYIPVPYTRFESGFSNQDFRTLQNLVAKKAENIDLAKFQEHLKTTDAWQRIVGTAHPEATFKNPQAVQTCENAMFALEDWGPMFEQNGHFPAYEAAMKGLNTLRSKFNAEPVPKDQASQSIHALIEQCSSAFDQVESILKDHTRPEVLRTFNTWKNVKSQPNAFAKHLKTLVQLNKQDLPDTNISSEQIQYLHSMLKQVEQLQQLPTHMSEAIQTSLQKDIQNDFSANNGELINALKALETRFASAESLNQALESLRTAPGNTEASTIADQFTQQFVEAVVQ